MIRTAVLLAAVAALLGATTASAAFPPIDLSAAGTTATSAVDNTVWTNTNLIQSAGTGVLDPFLRVQHNDTETGMNSDNSTPYLDSKAGIWTHSITFGDLSVQNINGTDYYVFSLDINEPNQDAAFLTLNELRMYEVGSGSGGALATEADVIAATGAADYNLDAIADQTVYMDYRVSNTGSGESDVDFGIPVSYFAGVSTDYLYMVVNFGIAGDPNGLDSADGFEEIRNITTGGTTTSTTSTTSTTEGPEPGTIALFGMGLIGLAAARRKN
jgi:hypothetical protein